ncbi:MAG: sugar-transfer associated ATP-grasp domain-containing protein [Halofilum sp. (in: g-proteobacteria)]|nr:sugar-transfer associated ATP-grasp domain-containing protein [Halofilum sp. (in: g-proteobacteria)]
MKPSHGSYGKGNTMLKGIEQGELIRGDGTRVPVADFCRSLAAAPGLGWILQEALAPHRDIAELCGDRISGVRVHSFMTSKGPEVFRAIWKINVGTKDSDNFHHGASGNMLADIDVATGAVTRIVKGIGFDQEVGPIHPVTGMDLTAFRLPHWDEIKRVVSEAHHAYPGFMSPGWDVAICDEGPLLLEVNAFGDVDLTQHAARRGFLDSELLAYLSDRRVSRMLPSQRFPWVEVNKRATGEAACSGTGLGGDSH